MEAVFDPQPMWKDYKGLMMYQIDNIEPWRVYKFAQNYWFERYTVETDINPERVSKRYNSARKLYTYYTGENIFTPVNDKTIMMSRFLLQKKRAIHTKKLKRFTTIC